MCFINIIRHVGDKYTYVNGCERNLPPLVTYDGTFAGDEDPADYLPQIKAVQFG